MARGFGGASNAFCNANATRAMLRRNMASLLFARVGGKQALEKEKQKGGKR